MEGQFRIYPLHLGTLKRQKINMAYMKDPGTVCDFPLISWYLTDGVHQILVDAGGIPADGKKYMPYTQTPEQTMPAALERIHVNPDDIEYVILTHLHWDHVGYIGMFKNAKFYVQQAELEYAKDPVKPQVHGYDLKWNMQVEYSPLVGKYKLLDGIEVIPTPGHTPGSQSVIVDTAGGKHIILGDFIALYECYDDLIPNGLHTDLREYYNAMERIHALNYTPLPGHDLKVLEHSVFPCNK